MKFGWVMTYPGKEGFFPEISDVDGIMTDKLPKANSRDEAIGSLKDWAKANPETPLTLMKKGVRL